MACPWWVSTLVDTVDPRHAWMHFDQLSKYSISMEIHSRMAWMYQPPPGNSRRRGGSGCGGVSAMDGATELTWTYLQRPPQPGPPRHPSGNPLLPLLRLLPLLLRVQGAALPNTPYLTAVTCTSITPSPTRACSASPGCTCSIRRTNAPSSARVTML